MIAGQQVTVLEGPGLRVEFERRGDRIGHRILVEGLQGLVPALESCEGTALEVWPPSPPFQELRVEQRGSFQVVLLIGMAGRSHWSASVELDPTFGRAEFDVACRLSASADWLGSRYTALAPWELSQDGLSACCRSGLLVCQVVAETPALTTVGLLKQSSRQISIGPVLDQGSGSRTLRWKYAVARTGR